MASRTRALTVVDRTTIGLRLAGCWGIRRIARGLGRSAGTISDEVSRNGGKAAYEAGAAASRAAAQRALTGRKPRMAQDGALFAEVSRLAGPGWPPEQISGRRKREEAALEAADVKVCPVLLRQRKAYSARAHHGQTALEHEPHGKAADEVTALLDWVFETLR